MLRRTSLAFLAMIAVIVFASFNRDFSFSKSILQNFVKVNESLYASKYEVSNAEYRNFLEALKLKEAPLAEKYKVDSAKWITYGYGGPMGQYYHLHAAYKNYPVVCVSYESALAYCEWLTEQYNADEKRKFKKVRFVLPTEEEWMATANGGNKNKMYPWSNHYLRNKSGQFLCNFKHVGDEFISYDEAKKEYTIIPEAKIAGNLSDIGKYTSAVNSYEKVAPYGIHNMSGNVAEMVSEKGIAKGGSFNSPGYDVRIQSRMNYSEASPEIGFRVFMKVLE